MIINKKWVLGVQDRGHDRYSYAVMSLEGDILLECGDNNELAEHIIAIHNKTISTAEREHKCINYCDKHGGYGFQSDCVECKNETKNSN